MIENGALRFLGDKMSGRQSFQGSKVPTVGWCLAVH